MFGAWRSRTWSGAGARLDFDRCVLTLGWAFLPRAARYRVDREAVSALWIVSSWQGQAFGLHAAGSRLNNNLFFPWGGARCRHALEHLGWPLQAEVVPWKEFRRMGGDFR